MGKSLKGKELGKGISQRKSDGLYMARFTNRFGKRDVIYAKTITEINKKLRDAQYENEKQINVVNNKMTLDEWFEKWLSTFKNNCRETTKHLYSVQYNRLRGSLGWRKLKTLNLTIMQNALNELSSDASRDDCKVLLVDMLDKAVKSDLIPSHAARDLNVTVTKDQKKEKRILSYEETQWLLDSAEEGYMKSLIDIALDTGMRLGEILGLCWNDVDFEKKKIHVCRTLTFLPNKGNPIYSFHAPKTISGDRFIPMTANVKKALLRQKLRKNGISNQYAPKKGFEDLVFVTNHNMPIRDTTVRISLIAYEKNIQKEHSEFEHVSPHCFRHTFATRCIAKGMKPKVLQNILGHSTLAMTMDLYCHVEDDTIKNEMALIAEMA